MKIMYYTYDGSYGKEAELIITNRGKRYSVSFSRIDFDTAEEAADWLTGHVNRFSPWTTYHRPKLRAEIKELAEYVYPDPNERPRAKHIERIEREYAEENAAHWKQIAEEAERAYPGGKIPFNC